jgi:hypothetical protein
VAESSCARAIRREKSDIVSNNATVIHFWKNLASRPGFSRGKLSIRNRDM